MANRPQLFFGVLCRDHGRNIGAMGSRPQIRRGMQSRNRDGVGGSCDRTDVRPAHGRGSVGGYQPEDMPNGTHQDRFNRTDFH